MGSAWEKAEGCKDFPCSDGAMNVRVIRKLWDRSGDTLSQIYKK